MMNSDSEGEECMKLFVSSQREGWLKHVDQNYKSKYFVLINYSLQWFLDPQQSVCDGQLDDLDEYRIEIGNQEDGVEFKLVLTTPTGVDSSDVRELRLQSQSSYDMKNWVKALEKAKEKRSNQLKEEAKNSLYSTKKGKAGWMMKLGHVVKNMKKRWFVLPKNEHKIYYYKEEIPLWELGPAHQPQGVIRLKPEFTSITDTSVTDPLGFIIKTSEPNGKAKNFLLIAESQEEKYAWIHVIAQRGVKKDIKHPSLAGPLSLNAKGTDNIHIQLLSTIDQLIESSGIDAQKGATSPGPQRKT